LVEMAKYMIKKTVYFDNETMDLLQKISEKINEPNISTVIRYAVKVYYKLLTMYEIAGVRIENKDLLS